MKKLLLLLLIMFCGIECFASVDVVYPKALRTTIDANSTFFIGASDLPLKINKEIVQRHSSGAFSYVVNLIDGENTFLLESGDEKKTYIITKPIISTAVKTCNSAKFVQYNQRKNYLTINDGAPLRETPLDSGINRLSHLQKEIPLIVDGEDDNFYRVVLNDNAKAWILKADVSSVENEYISNPVTIKGYRHMEDEKFDIFIFDLDKKTPFVMKEGNIFTLTFYNVKNNPNSTYVFSFPVNHKLFGYIGGYDGNKFILKIRKLPLSLKALTVAIDAGHGGSEFGAVSCFGDKEKDLNLAISKYTEEELKSRGVKVVMTRKSDVNVGLKSRVDYANRENADILISIHGNALPDNLNPNTHRGTSVYYYYNQSKPLAQSILNSITATVNTKNDEVRQGSLALVRNTNALSILIEVAYLINPDDSVLLKDIDFQKKCAKAIADGIENYLK